MTTVESSLEAEIEHLVAIVKQLQEEVNLLKRDIYLLQSNQTQISHIGTFVQ